MADNNSGESFDLNAALDAALDTDDSSSESEETNQETDSEETETDEDREGDKDEEEEEEELSETDEEDDEGDVEDPIKQARSTSIITKVKEKYKGIFKEFPELKDNFFIAQEMKQVFPTVDDAKNAQIKGENFDKLSEMIFTGNVGQVFEEIYKEDPAALKTVVTNFLPTLSKKSKALFTLAVTPVVQNLFHQIASAAKQSNNEQLMLAARICMQHISGAPNIPPRADVNIDVQENLGPTPEGIQAFNNFYGAITDNTVPFIKREILKDLPDNLSKGLRRTILQKSYKRVLRTLENSPTHMSTMKTLANAAIKRGYPDELKKRIRREIIRNAREVIPSIRTKTLKSLGVAVGGVNSDPKITNLPNSNNQMRNVGGKTPIAKDAPNIDWSKTDLRDALDGKYVTRK